MIKSLGLIAFLLSSNLILAIEFEDDISAAKSAAVVTQYGVMNISSRDGDFKGHKAATRAHLNEAAQNILKKFKGVPVSAKASLLKDDHLLTRYESAVVISQLAITFGIHNYINHTNIEESKQDESNAQIDLANIVVKMGLMNTYPDGFFKGERVLTRFELAKSLCLLISRIEGKQGRQVACY